MQIHHLAINVQNLEKSIYFYETLTQLEVRIRIEANPGELAYLHNAEGETELELIAMPAGQKFSGNGLFLCFATSELDTAHQRALESGMNPSDIRHPEPNARYFYVYDPDGVSVQLREY